MNSKVYKWCAVPQCDNTSIKAPKKLFVFVPHKKTIRDKWLKLARRDSTGILPSTHLYFCEDHFDLPNDMDNFMEYHIMGSVSQVRMKPGCIPTKFECQADRRKRTASRIQRLKQRRKVIDECLNELQKRKTVTKENLSTENTPSNCSADAIMSRPALSTHVLDTSTGKPAARLFVELYKKKDDSWVQWHNTVTSGDGRIQFPFSKELLSEGTYKLKFDVGDYYKNENKDTLYPYVEIVFNTKEGEHYHIPLLLSPYGYSTYRGT